MERIAQALESINEDGIVVRIKFPDVVDKFVTDLPAMKIADAINELTTVICGIHSSNCVCEDKETEQKEITLETDITDVDWSNRAINCLKRDKCNTIQDVLNAYYDGRLPYIKNLGRKTYEQVIEKLVNLGFLSKEVFEQIIPKEVFQRNASHSQNKQ